MFVLHQRRYVFMLLAYENWNKLGNPCLNEFIKLYTHNKGSICSGRNVALKQYSSQSSNYIENSVVYDSTRAVDGNPSGDFYRQLSCTHTLSSSPSTWEVHFDYLMSVNRYTLYNRGKMQLHLSLCCVTIVQCLVIYPQ